MTFLQLHREQLQQKKRQKALMVGSGEAAGDAASMTVPAAATLQFKFHEGFSNAVRRTVTVGHFM